MRTLIFDAIASGHHGEFLENIIYGIANSENCKFTILAHPKLEARLENAKSHCDSEIDICYIKDSQLKKLDEAKGLLERGKLELEVVKGFCSLWEINRVLLMHMNVHQLALRNSLRQKSISVRGILLDPYTPQRRSFTLRKKIHSGLTGLRKKLQFRVMLINSRLDRIFVLNDKALANSLNRCYPNRRPFASVVDPIPAAMCYCDQSIPRKVNRVERYTFLLIGSLTPRKGCMEVLQALSHLSSEELSKIRLRFVGKFVGDDGDYRRQVFAAIHNLKKNFPAVSIEVIDRYIDFSEMNLELHQANCVLAPYIDFFGSSGILGHACRQMKPLIACEQGLLGELVRELQVGMTVNPKDLACLAACLICAIRGELPFSNVAATRYVKDADYRNFCETLIGNWGDAKAKSKKNLI